MGIKIWGLTQEYGGEGKDRKKTRRRKVMAKQLSSWTKILGEDGYLIYN